MEEGEITFTIKISPEVEAKCEALLELCGFKDLSELHDSAFAILSWAVLVAAKGDYIASYNQESHTVHQEKEIQFLDEIRSYAKKHPIEHLTALLR